MKYIVSLSGGKDSVALTLGLIERKYKLDEAVYYNNGMDFAAIHNVIYEQVKPRLEEYGARLVELHPKNEFLYDAFERPVNGKSGTHYGYSWCGGKCRWGTTEKVKVIDRYARGAVQYIGIAADEKQRLEKERADGKEFPLAEWGMTEADCLRYCRDNGIAWTEHTHGGDIDLYDVLDRVSCYCCGNKNLRELEAIYWKLPEYWQKLREMQERTERPFKKSGSIFELEQRFEARGWQEKLE